MQKLKIEYVSPEELVTYENNAKIHTAHQIEQIKSSIEEFGFNDPIAVWDGNVIIEGHGRLIAAHELGLDKVPIIRLDNLTDEQRRAYMLVHNQLTMNTEFDFETLQAELQDIENFDMSFFDFDLNFDEEESEEVQDVEIPDPPKKAKSKTGEIWALGRHRLICGDCTKESVIDALFEGQRADIVITSPPYGAKVAASVRETYEPGKERIKSLYLDHPDDENTWLKLMCDSYEQMRKVTDAQFINLQMLADNKRDMIRWLNIYQNRLCDVMVWNKKKGPPQMHENVLNNMFEFVFIFGEDDASRQIPFADFHGTEGNLFELLTGKNEYADVHRAVFPIGVPEKILNLASNAETVFDPFGGTGTTLIACEQMGRTCYMAELTPEYCELTVSRWETLTGEKAVKL